MQTNLLNFNLQKVIYKIWILKLIIQISLYFNFKFKETKRAFKFKTSIENFANKLENFKVGFVKCLKSCTIKNGSLIEQSKSCYDSYKEFLSRDLKLSDSRAAYTWHILKSRGSHKKGKFELKLHVFLKKRPICSKTL